MKVMVTGSYRPHEPDYHFAPGRWDEFKQAARNLGRGLAERKHTLILAWSNVNLFSQLGAKDKVRGNPASHPYWETADYHALMGYLSHAEADPTARTGCSVVVHVLGKHPQLDSDQPFPNPSILNATPGMTDHVGGDRPGAPALQPFEAGDWIDLAPHLRSGFVSRIAHGTEDSIQMRQKMLADLAGSADAVIVLGGGKATERAAEIARRQGKLIAVSPFCAGGPICAVDEGAAAGLDNLARELRLLAGLPPRPLAAVAAVIPDQREPRPARL